MQVQRPVRTRRPQPAGAPLTAHIAPRAVTTNTAAIPMQSPANSRVPPLPWETLPAGMSGAAASGAAPSACGSSRRRRVSAIAVGGIQMASARVKEGVQRL